MLRDQLRQARPSVSSPTYLLLSGKITDAEYRVAIDAQWRGLRWPRSGWSSRPARIRRAVLEVLSLVALLVVFGFTVWAMSIPMPAR